MLGCEGGAAELGCVVVEPLACVEHQHFGIVVGHGIVGTEVGNVAAVLSLDVGLGEMLRAVGVAE